MKPGFRVELPVRNDSTADNFIDVMAKINALGDLVDIDEPMRHEIRSIKAIATQILDDAISQARRLADVAKDIPVSAREAANKTEG